MASAFLVAMAASPAQATIDPTFNAGEIAAAIDSTGSTVSDARFVKVPPGYKAGAGYPNISPAAVSDTPLTTFATAGSSYAILSTGDPRIADDPNDKANSGYNAGSGHFQGVDNFDATVLRVDVEVPDGANCLSFDYRFLSEEFDEYVGGGYNDTFIAQLGRSDWYAGPDAVSAPGDFATDGTPIGVDSAGAYGVNSDESTGTTYDAATRMITARTAVAAGTQSVYFSIFDQGDPTYDSAVFLDNLKVGTAGQGGCVPSPEPGTTSVGGAVPTGQPTQGTGGGASVSAGQAPSSQIGVMPKRVRRGKLRRFEGSASAGAGVARVQVALVGLKHGARASRRGKRARCVQMNSRQLLFQRRAVKRKCKRLEWLTADGTDQWSMRLRRKLPKGKYVLYSRAIDRNGKTEKNFSTASGNKVTFKVY